MKLAHFTEGGLAGLGIYAGDGLMDLRKRLPPHIKTMIDLIGQWSAVHEQLDAMAALPADLSMEQVTLKAPISRPGKIMAIGLNYADHAAETGMELPAEQLWFSKAVTSAATDYVAAYAGLIGCFVDAPFTSLGTDGFGRSDTRTALRRFFEVDRYHVVLAALRSLIDIGALNAELSVAAIHRYGIDGQVPPPWSR